MGVLSLQQRTKPVERDRGEGKRYSHELGQLAFNVLYPRQPTSLGVPVLQGFQLSDRGVKKKKKKKKVGLEIHAVAVACPGHIHV